MNPINLIADTLIAAAAHSQQQTLAPSATEHYHQLVDLLADRQIELARVQKKPDSPGGHASLLEDLTDANADQDADLLAATLTLLATLRDQAPAESTSAEQNQSIGIDIDNVVAANANIFDVVSDDLAVRIRNSEFLGTVHVGQVVAGETGEGQGGRSGAIQMKDVKANEIHVGDKIYQTGSPLDLSS